ncbi:MAG: dihydrofolate reductase [Bacilli bacterium]
MKNLSLIAAIGYNNELGLDNRLLWHIPEDLAFYKKMTMGKNIIMGRNTFESMPEGAFKGRNPIVLSTKQIDRYADVICYNNINDLIKRIKNSDEDFIVVGGSKVYEEFLPYIDVMYLTEIYKEYTADAYFPYFDRRLWDNIKIANYMEEEIPYERNIYVRKKMK